MKILHDECNNSQVIWKRSIRTTSFNLYVCVSQIWLLSVVSIITRDQVIRSTDSRSCSTLRYLHCGADLPGGFCALVPSLNCFDCLDSLWREKMRLARGKAIRRAHPHANRGQYTSESTMIDARAFQNRSPAKIIPSATQSGVSFA